MAVRSGNTETTPAQRADALGKVEKILTALDPAARRFVIGFIHDSYPSDLPASPAASSNGLAGSPLSATPAPAYGT
jgi:hypothetical protein